MPRCISAFDDPLPMGLEGTHGLQHHAPTTGPPTDEQEGAENLSLAAGRCPLKPARLLVWRPSLMPTRGATAAGKVPGGEPPAVSSLYLPSARTCLRLRSCLKTTLSRVAPHPATPAQPATNLRQSVSLCVVMRGADVDVRPSAGNMMSST